MRSDRHLMMAGAMLVGVIGLTVAAFVWPNYREAAGLRREARELHTKIASLEGQSRVVDELQDELTRAQSHVESELKIIPPSADLASLIRRLSQEVDRVVVLDQTFTAGNPIDAVAGEGDSKPDIQAMPLTIEMESTFDAVLGLIRNAESLQRLVRITNIRISCKRDGKDAVANARLSPILKSSVSLEAIFQPFAAGASAMNAPAASSHEGR